LAKTGLGGPQGDGKQMMSWIHIDDFCRAVAFLIEHDNIHGPVNLSSPDARSNASFMRTLRKAVGMPIGLPAPAFAIQIGSRFTGVDPSLILDSRYLSPDLLRKEGFQFEKGTLELALEELLK
jgi:NAD dependent epimerase/dehydratase family enzyme